MTIPIVLTKAGRQPVAPDVLRAEVVAIAVGLSPGLTTDLPGTLIEDMTSTEVGALVVTDSAVTEVINSITPYGANEYLLNQQAVLAGVLGQPLSNTSVFVVFRGPAGFLISKGFTVTDGTYQYVVQDGGIIETGGQTILLYALATIAGTWSVPANTVTALVTSVPSSVSPAITVTNPTAGIPSAGAESVDVLRARTIEAYGHAAAQGMPTFLRMLLGNVIGVQPRLISIQQQSPGWKIIVGGGDPYAVAYAIFIALFDISILVGSTTTARNITVTINDFPNTYSVIFVNPPQQAVTISLLWGTISPNFISDAAVAAAGAPALAAYVNSVYAGQPMNLFDLQATFQASVADIIPTEFLTRMAFSVYIDTVLTNPTTGTGIIAGDPESYFLTDVPSITIARG